MDKPIKFYHNMSFIQKIKHSDWFQENKGYFFWVLVLNLLYQLVILVIILINNYSFSDWITDQKVIISIMSTLLIPLLAIFGIYLGKKKGKKCSTFWKIMLTRTIGMILGVWLGTLILELWSFSVNITDDDNIALGAYELSPELTNFIENTILALLIGFPFIYKEAINENIEWQLKQKEEELEKVYKLKMESELAAIHARVNPHFLYNSLNSIVSLIHFDPNRAEKMVLSLSDLFRYSINSSENHFASIEDEIQLVKTYLEIEHVRFEDQLDYRIDVDPELLNEQIPKFLIQPLVENAIKHGTSNISKGEINIQIQQNEEWISITIEDNGPDFPEPLDSGYGLKSTIGKLDLLYPDNYKLSISNHPQKQLNIKLKNQ